jgi:hypothetical protein
MTIWIAERGTKLILLEQLWASVSLTGAVKTPYALGTYNLTALMMLILWSFSVLGGQATLRVISTGQQTITSSVPIYYFNTSVLASSSYLSVSENPTYYIPELNTIYSAALIAPTETQDSPMDNWGNVKIPMLESLDSNTADASGWIPVPTGNVTYSSLVGSPVAGIPPTGLITLEIISSYFHLNCQNLRLLPPSDEYFWTTADEVGLCDRDHPPSTFGSSRFINNTVQATFSIGSITENTWNISFDQNTLSTSTNLPRQILFQSFSTNWISTTNCTLAFSTAQSRIGCTDKNCSVTHMRPYSPAFPRNLTPLEDCKTAKNFYQEFVAMVGPYRPIWHNLSVPSETEVYLMIGSNPLSLGVYSSTLPTLSNTTTGAQMSERLSRLMNTYWTASLAPEYIAGGMSKFNFTAGSNEMFNHPGNFTDATVEIMQNVYICDDVWLGVLVLSSGILLLVAVGGLVLKFKVIAPEIFGRVSSSTRDNPHVQVPLGGTTLDGAKRTKLLKDVDVKLGDTQPDKDVGHIAFASTGPGLREVGTLKRNRMYL